MTVIYELYVRKDRKSNNYLVYAEKINRLEKRMKEKKKKGQNANTYFPPFVFASQMKMQAFSFEAWCKS